MEPRVKKFRIPTLGAIMLLIAALVVIFYAGQRGTSIVSRATPDRTPRLVSVVNIKDDSFAVSYVTSDTSVGSVVVLGESGENKFYDLRGGERNSHFIVVDGLSPGGSYSFAIESDGRRGEQRYQVSTASSLEADFRQGMINGRVVNDNGSAVEDAVVLLDHPGAQLLGGVSDRNGEFRIDLSNLRTGDLEGFVLLDDEDKLRIRILSGDLDSEIQSVYKNLELPEITLGRDYNFAVAEDIDVSTPSGLFSVPSEEFAGVVLSIQNPIEDATLIDEQPLFSGTAPAESSVTLTFLRTGEATTVISDAFGRWSYRPPSPIAVGRETVTVVGLSSAGVREQKERTFTVLSSGSQINQSATPSATPTDVPITSTPTITPTPTFPAPTPTEIVPTPTSTPLPVGGIETPTPTNSVKSPTPILSVTPEAPGDIGGVFITFISIAFILTGATILFILA